MLYSSLRYCIAREDGIGKTRHRCLNYGVSLELRELLFAKP